MKTVWLRWIVLLGVLAFCVAGWSRLHFETDVSSTLPPNEPSSDALRLIRKNFVEEQRVVIVLENTDGVFEEDAADLAAVLEKALPEAKVEYRSAWDTDPEEAAASIASLWSHADPEKVAQFVDLLSSDEKVQEQLATAKETISGSMDVELVERTAYDPLGFLNLPDLRQLSESEFAYASEDEALRLLFVENKDLGKSYKVQAEWVARIREALPDWSEDGFSIQLTGAPIYAAETGSGIKKDMGGTVTVTAVLVGLLFFLMQRDWRQLLLVGGILVVTFGLAFGLSGWLLGSLNLVSAGFAAILLGLVIDYTMVLAREAEEGISEKELRGKLLPGIGWAAATTCLVFGTLGLSSFTVVRELGGLVVIGLLTGAGISLWLAPLFLTRWKLPKKKTSGWTLFLGPRRAWMGVLLPVIVMVVIFAAKGAPSVTFESGMSLPKGSEAVVALDEIKEKFPAWSDRNWDLVTVAESQEQLRERAEEAERELARLQEEGLIERYQWPLSVLPEKENWERNEANWRKVGARREAILALLEKEGFSEKGRAYTGLVLAELPRPLEASSDLEKLFLARLADGREVFRGRVLLAEGEDGSAVLERFEEKADGTSATGLAALKLALSPLVKHDFVYLFLPLAGAVLLLSLLLAFRSWWEAVVPGLVMLMSMGLVIALSVVLGIEWNFLNGMAIPLIVGTGIDYGIHLIFALRREKGNQALVWHGVGKAILFCGLSSAIGFGSLTFASNELLATMGFLCGAGILLTMTLSLLLIPGLWLSLGNRFRKGEPEVESGPSV